jgi:hypothetical protein
MQQAPLSPPWISCFASLTSIHGPRPPKVNAARMKGFRRRAGSGRRRETKRSGESSKLLANRHLEAEAWRSSKKCWTNCRARNRSYRSAKRNREPTPGGGRRRARGSRRPSGRASLVAARALFPVRPAPRAGHVCVSDKDHEQRVEQPVRELNHWTWPRPLAGTKRGRRSWPWPILHRTLRISARSCSSTPAAATTG